MKDLQREYNEAKARVGGFLAITSIVLIAIVVILLSILIPAIISGIIGYFCWNYAIVNMFHFNSISLVNACIITITIGMVFSSLKECWQDVYDEVDKELNSKIGRAVVATLFVAAIFALTSYLVMLSWNNIIPNILGVEVTKINYIQSMLFAFLINYLFGNVNRNKDWAKKRKEKND